MVKKGDAQYLSVPQAAEELDISPQGVRKLITLGTIQATKIGQRALIIPSAQISILRKKRIKEMEENLNRLRELEAR